MYTDTYINTMTQKECYEEITELGHKLNKNIKVINNDLDNNYLRITLRRYTEELLNSKQWTGNMAQKFEELNHQCDDTYSIELLNKKD